MSFILHWQKDTYTEWPISLSLSFSNRHHPRCLPCWLEELRLWEGGQIMCLSRCQGTAVGMRPWEQLLLVWLLADGSIRLEQRGAWRWMRLNASMCARAYAFKRDRSYPRWNRVRCCVRTNWAVQGKRVILSNAVCHNTPGIKTPNIIDIKNDGKCQNKNCRHYISEKTWDSHWHKS